MKTAFTEFAGVEHPLVQAGMSTYAGAKLAGAVSGAGALGTIGSLGRTADELLAEVHTLRAMTPRPFAVNVVAFEWGPPAADIVDAVIDARIPVVTLSFGDPLPAFARCKAAGIRVIVQVQSFAGARTVIAAGADAIIAQGTEAGGHTGRRGTLNFAAEVLDAAGDIPVLVAGGVGTGRGLAAALAMGAGGVVMGTRFKATPECEVRDDRKAALVVSDGDNTVFDEIVDIAHGGVWPNGIAGRVLTNDFTAEWLDRDAELQRAVEAAGVEAFATALDADPRRSLNWAGESAGLVGAIMPAAEIVRMVVADAERLLRRVDRVLAK